MDIYCVRYHWCIKELGWTYIVRDIIGALNS